MLQHAAQHPLSVAIHCTATKFTASRCNTLQHAATRCIMLQHAAIPEALAS